MKKPAPEIYLSQAQVGAALGLSQSQASRDLRDAEIGPEPDGYPLSALVALVEWRYAQRLGLSDGRTYDVDAERGRLLAAQADLTELRIGEARADLVRMSVVEMYWSELGSTCRSKLAAIPSRLAAAIADPKQRHKITAECEALIYESLAEIQKEAVPHEIRARANRTRGDAVPGLASPAAETDA